MKRKSDLEKKAYLAYHGDGLVDLALGMVVLLFGLGMHFDQTLFAPIFAAVAYPVWLAAKKRITERRLGYVEFGEQRKRKEKRGLMYLFILGCLALMLGIILYVVLTRDSVEPGLLGGHGYLMLGVIFAVMISSVGLVLGVLRLHIYSLLILHLVSMGHFLDWPRPYGIIIPGSVIVVCGIALLIRFLRKYPVSDREDDPAT